MRHNGLVCEIDIHLISPFVTLFKEMSITQMSEIAGEVSIRISFKILSISVLASSPIN